MLWLAEYALAAVEGALVERQSSRPGHPAACMHKARFFTLASVCGCAMAEHALVAVEGALVERQSPRRVAERLHATRQIVTLVSVSGCSVPSPRSRLSSARTQKRQGSRRVAKHLHAPRQIVHAGRHLRMVRAEHALAALQRSAVERQKPPPRRQAPSCKRPDLVHASDRVRMLRAEHVLSRLSSARR